MFDFSCKDGTLLLLYYSGVIANFKNKREMDTSRITCNMNVMNSYNFHPLKDDIYLS
jgi:hypothetical protein